MKTRVPAPLATPPDEPCDDLTLRNVETVARIEQAYLEQRSTGERLSDLIARFCGSMTFVWFHVILFGGWILWNVAPGTKHFDPFPFQFLTLTVSLEAIFLTTFILISQNRQSEIADRRNMLDLQINLLAEQENSKMLAMLEAIMERLGMEVDDPELRVLEEATSPEAVLEHISRIRDEEGQVSSENTSLESGMVSATSEANDKLPTG
jgi:uncharacterized membrane protein